VPAKHRFLQKIVDKCLEEQEHVFALQLSDARKLLLQIILQLGII
jgi:hypothetical protein